MLGFDLQKNGAILAFGVMLGVMGGGAVRDLWKITPFSAESRLSKAQSQVMACSINLAGQQQAVKDRDKALAERDALLIKQAGEAGQDQSATVARWGQQCLAAFNSGLAAGRADSRKGAANASPTPSPRPAPAAAGQPLAGGVRNDFRDGWAQGAYIPAAPAATGAGDLSRSAPR